MVPPPTPAASLGCPRCGAPASPEAVRCDHCGTALALVACPACFARIFRGARHCSHCGAEADRGAASAIRAPRPCPRCREPLAPVQVGRCALDECPRCGGVWAEAAVFERILEDGEAQAHVLGAAQLVTPALSGASQPYVPCPTCSRLMNRFNFARCSGVLIDTCKGHGTWFDRDELRRIVEFVRKGGLVRAREKEKEDLEAARRRLRAQELKTQRAHASPWSASYTSSVEAGAVLDTELLLGAVDAIASVGHALGDWLSD